MAEDGRSLGSLPARCGRRLSWVVMLLLIALQEATGTDYDETLRIPAIVLFAVALLYAIVAAWMVTTKMERHH
jgi:hypothetical protein